MADTPNTAQITADNAILIEKVAYPVFYQKLAEAGHDARSEGDAVKYARVADDVSAAVERYVGDLLAGRAAAKSAAVDGALTALRMIAGESGAPAAPAAPPGEFLGDPVVKAAARRMALEQLKAAGLADAMGPPAGPAVETACATPGEDEDEKKKKEMKDKGAPAAAA